jgi:hypothetical protein
MNSLLSWSLLLRSCFLISMAFCYSERIFSVCAWYSCYFFLCSSSFSFCSFFLYFSRSLCFSAFSCSFLNISSALLFYSNASCSICDLFFSSSIRFFSSASFCCLAIAIRRLSSFSIYNLIFSSFLYLICSILSSYSIICSMSFFYLNLIFSSSFFSFSNIADCIWPALCDINYD